MPAQQRFERLLPIVFPPYDHSIRVEIDFTPTHPSPPVIAELGLETDGPSLAFERPPSRVPIGGQLISPAIDLVEAASELGRLDDLRDLIEQRHPGETNSKPHRALQALVAIAGEDVEAARDAIGRLREAAVQQPVLEAERGPEAVAIWAGARDPQTQDVARDLAFLVYEQARTDQGPRSERWHRHIYSLKHLLQWMAENRNGAHAERLSNWTRVSRMTAETCGKGFPAAGWDTRPGEAQHITGHEHDYLYYAAPLTGDFEVEGDFTTFGYRETHIAIGNLWAGPSHDLKTILSGDFRREHQALAIDPPLTRMYESMRVRAVVRDGTRTTYINGRTAFEAPHPGGSDPWVAIHSPWYTNGIARDLRITGAPTIPEEINLVTAEELPGWLPYFDESAGRAESDWHLESTAQSVLIGRRRPGIAGSHAESLLRYHRPMLEDGVIAYEFFYRPDEIAVHPALGRLCFLLSPVGVGVHWLTDGKFDRTGLDPANITLDAENQRREGPLPLAANEWNRIELALRGATVNLHLNGKLVYSRDLEPTNQRTFGLFHYADATEARVRNIRWRGEWPRSLPPPTGQQLADSTIDELLEAAKLPLVFEHDFSEGLPLDRFLVIGAGWENDTELLPSGVRMKRTGGNYARYGIAPQLTLSGDFDITVAFEGLQMSAVAGGEGNIQLLAALGDERMTECRVFRKHYVLADHKHEQLAQAAVFQRRGEQTDYSFPASPAEESMSGRLRLARRGSQMFFLYAEHDSPEFRLIHSQQVATAETRIAGVRLVIESNKPRSLAEVVWKNIKIRAESASGPLTHPALSMTQLDQQSRQLPAGGRCNLSSTARQDAFTFWGSPARTSRSREGMTIDAPGADQWTATGVMSRIGLEGNFDVSLDLDVLHLERPAANQESTVYLQTEFDDERRTAVEAKFAITPSGIRAVEMQLNRRNRAGSMDYQELASRQVEAVRQLRLARRDGILYLLFRPGENAPSQVLARAEVGDAPVPPTFLRALVHTGGAGRKTVVRLKNLRIRAERLIGPAALLEDE